MRIDLEQFKRLEEEWKKLQPLSPANDERLWLKLRLEWNYHSNHIEGNTLTYGETAAYLLHDQVSTGHSGREYAEMKGHDLAIELVRKLAGNPQELTEVDVRNLDQIILKEPFYKEAITPAGATTRKLITPGDYKKEPNSVRTSTGELFEYAPPLDVPVRMAKLIETVRKCIDKEGLEFLAALAITHHEFTLIHPFDDGNGRVARLMTNYALLKKGLPPLVIRSDRKKDYLSALREADGGNPALLTTFFTDQLVWSLELGIKAAKGESLEEPLDVEKEIELFVREQKNQKKQILKKSPEVLCEFLEATVPILFGKIDDKTKKIGELFEFRELAFSANIHLRGDSWRIILDSLVADIISSRSIQLSHLSLQLILKGFQGEAPHPFGLNQAVTLQFQEYEYRIDGFGGHAYHATYAEKLTEEKADEIVSDFLKLLLKQVKQHSKQ